MTGGAGRRRLATGSALVVLAACAEGPPKSEPQGLPLLEIAPEPSLQIGVLDGDPRYVFQSISAVLELPDGSVAVADAGASEIAQFDRNGSFVRRFGGHGDGPGEFRSLSAIYAYAADSILAFDAWTGRLSVFDARGTFARQMPAVDLSGDSTFALDVWLYGRWWVQGAALAGQRRRVRRRLDLLPPPLEEPGYRVVRVSHDGRLWIREPRLNPDGTRTWTVADASGHLAGTIDLPVRFEPFEIREDRVTGRWRGASDVHFVRRYTVTNTDLRRRAPSWAYRQRDGQPAGEGAGDGELLERMRMALRALARAQEIHYSTEMTYTAFVDSLDWEPPGGIVTDVVSAGTRGWVAVFTHPALDRICGLGYGYDVPPGWMPGEMVCGPRAAASRAGGD